MKLEHERYLRNKTMNSYYQCALLLHLFFPYNDSNIQTELKVINIHYCDDSELLSFARQEATENVSNGQIAYINYTEGDNSFIDQIYQMDLFVETKRYIVTNATFLLSSEPSELAVSEKLAIADGVEVDLFINTNNFEDFNEVIQKYKGKFTFKKITKFNDAKKRKMIEKMLNQSNVKIENEETFALLLDALDDNPFAVKTEIEKLISAGDQSTISRHLIAATINSSSETNVFKMVTFLLSDNKRGLIQLYDDLICMKYQPMELLQIMSGQIYNLKLLKCAFINQWDGSTIEQVLGIKKFLQEVNRSVLTRISLEHFDELINRFSQLDYNIKRSLVNPYHGMKLALIK
jgi:DNA polymerase-3 subunit delta